MTKEKLENARANKKDEFYTQLVDIEKQILNHLDLLLHFNDKIVYCNCDDDNSNFFKFFIKYFEELKIKKVVATSINSKYQYEYLGREFGIQSYVIDDGNFNSRQCRLILEQADIVVTNPPFSKIKEYIKLLFDYKKKFLFIGSQNIITYKEIFPLIANNQMWLSYGFKGNVGYFYSPYEDNAVASQHKEGFIRVSGVNWFTNLEIDKQNKPLELIKEYNSELYPKFDYYDAINVNKTSDIPKDYDGIIGVPLTFLNKYCPTQFEILNGVGRYALIGSGNPKGTYGTNIKGKRNYFRILIRKR